MKTILIVFGCLLLGSAITWVIIWLQQFGNTAAAKVIRDEMDRKREIERQINENKR